MLISSYVYICNLMLLIWDAKQIILTSIIVIQSFAAGRANETLVTARSIICLTRSIRDRADILLGSKQSKQRIHFIILT